MEDRLAKVGIAGIGAIISFLSDSFTPLLYIVAFLAILDYITGITVAWKNKELSSKKAIYGFVKKTLYFALIGVAFSFDFLIHQASTYMISEHIIELKPIFGTLALCYLISGECISILENLNEFGIKIPFLTDALKLFRTGFGKKKKDEANEDETKEDETKNREEKK
jgi:toxin secretion/phage lysis holin